MLFNDAGEPLFICFDHGIVYNPSVDLMCWVCERELAKQHDPLFKENEHDV